MPGPAPDSVIARALAEDVGSGDVTTDAIVPADLRGSADVVVREAGVICGLDQAFAVLLELDPEARMRAARRGRRPGRSARRRWWPGCTRRVRALLTGERTALNLLQRMSGIATTTRRYADLVAGTGVQLLDTRKTAPGLRALDKHAVACGGGTNHRAGPARRRADQGQPRGRRRRRAGRDRARPPAPSRTPGRGRGRHARPAAAGARRRRRRDPARQHAARRSCAGRWRRRPAAHAWRRPAASPSTPSARWPRPGSTRSRWERSRTRCARSTSHWRYHHQHPDRHPISRPCRTRCARWHASATP